MQEKILGFIVAFGNGHSVRFPTRTAADAMARFLARRGMEATVYAHLAPSGDGETSLLPVYDTPRPVPVA
jgi:hypothetical protein